MYLEPLRKIHELVDRLKREPIGAALVSLVGDSAVYLAGGILIGLGNIVLIPLYTRTLTLREFGVYAMVDVTILLIVTVTGLKLDVSYLKWFADLDPARRGELLGSTLLAGLAASAVGGAALSLIVASRAGELWLQASARSYAWLLLPILVLENLQALLLTDLRARRRAVPYSLAAVVRLAAMVVVSYYLLAIRQAGLPGLFLGRLVGDAAAFVFLGAISLRSVVFRVSWSLLLPMLRFGAPLIWSVFAVMFQDASGRYFLSRYGTLEQVGLLGASVKIGAVFQMFINVPFGVAWGGVLFQIVKERDAQIIYSKIFSYVYVLALGVALVLAIFAPTLFHIFAAPAYYPAIALLPLVLLVRAMNVIEQPASTGIYLRSRTDLLALSYTVALVVNVLLLRMLVPRFGMFGVGWSWLFGSALVPALFLIFGQRRYRLLFQAKLLLLPVVLWATVFFLLKKGIYLRSDHPLAFQCVLGFGVLLFIGGWLLHDFFCLRRRLDAARVSSPVLEVSLQ